MEVPNLHLISASITRPGLKFRPGRNKDVKEPLCRDNWPASMISRSRETRSTRRLMRTHRRRRGRRSCLMLLREVRSRRWGQEKSFSSAITVLHRDCGEDGGDGAGNGEQATRGEEEADAKVERAAVHDGHGEGGGARRHRGSPAGAVEGHSVNRLAAESSLDGGAGDGYRRC
jgi:hypothetical protein